VSGNVDTKFVDHFAGVLSKANLQGPDYFEFREILRNLSNLGLPEEKQFQAAWASFKAMASTGDPGILATAANQYLAALSADRDSFLKSVESAMQERVGGLQAEQAKLQADNEAIGKQIAELQQRAAANTSRLDKISGEVIEQTSKISQNKANFETTYATFTDQIKADVTKIATYLK
jgi:DNA repair exonuclease SbcCD ATPase subunit